MTDEGFFYEHTNLKSSIINDICNVRSA